MTKWIYDVHPFDMATMDEFRLECAIADEPGMIHMHFGYGHASAYGVAAIDNNGRFVGDTQPPCYDRSFKAISQLVKTQLEKRRDKKE